MNARSVEDPPPATNLSALLFGAGAAEDDTVIVQAASAEVTAGELRGAASDIAARLVAAGVGAGDRVGVLAPSDVTALAALFGAWRAGAVVVPLNPRITDPEIAATLEATGPVLVVASEANAEVHGAVLDPARVLLVGSDASSIDPLPVERTAGAERDRDDPDVALILTTSGTTGTPKPVQLRHGSILAGIDTVLDKLTGGRAADPAKHRPPNIIPVPLALWAGLYNVLFAMRSGAGVILLDPFTTAGFSDVVRTHGIKSSVLAPAMISMLADDPAIDDLAPLRIVRSITAPLSPLQARRFHERFGIAVLNSYGQTELGGEVIGWNAADSRDFGSSKLGAIGRPHAGIELQVRDGDTVVDAGAEGELCIRSPYMMAGYLDTELGDRLTADGYLRTGDIGWIDDDGFVWLSGRVSDLIIRGGLKVFPAEIEEVLRLHPSVGDVAVVGIPDERLGEVPWAFIVPAATVDPDEVTAFLREHLAPYKVPVRFETVDALPRSEVGKVLRRDLVLRAQPAETP